MHVMKSRPGADLSFPAPQSGPPRVSMQTSARPYGYSVPASVQGVANDAHMRIQGLRRRQEPSIPPRTIPGVLYEGQFDPSSKVYRNTGARDEAPSRTGAGVSSLVAARQVENGMYLSGLRGLSGSGRACESAGAHAAQGILGAAGGILTTLGSGGFHTENASGTGVTGSQISPDAMRNLSIAGASTNIATLLYTNICDARTEARTGIVGSGTASQTALDWRTAAAGITQQIQASRVQGGTTQAATVTTPPGSTPTSGPTATDVAAPSSNTWMYVAGGVAALAVLGLVVMK
jgi:hypothetical protein